jgi:hypothetical protein
MQDEATQAVLKARLENMHPDIEAAFRQSASNRLEVEENQRRNGQLPPLNDQERQAFSQAAFEESVLHVTPFPGPEVQAALVRRAEANEAAGFGKKEHRPHTLYSMLTSGIGMPGPNFAETALMEEQQEAARWQADQFLKAGKPTGNEAVDRILAQDLPPTEKRRALMGAVIDDAELRAKAIESHQKPTHMGKAEGREERAGGFLRFS